MQKNPCLMPAGIFHFPGNDLYARYQFETGLVYVHMDPYG